MRNLSTIYPGRTTIDANNPDGTFKNEVTPGVSDDGTPLEEQWQQDIWGAFAHLLNKVSVSPDGAQENEAASQIYDALESSARTLWTATETAKGSGFLRKPILLSNGSDASHDIDTTAGNFIFADGSGSANIGAFTKQIDATWAVGSAAGGMASALHPVSNNTFYHYFALSDASGAVVDFGFDTSITATNLLADAAVIAAGLTKYSLIESVLTDGSANILGFYDTGVEIRFKDQILDINDNTPGTSANTAAISTPTGRQVDAIIHAVALTSGTFYFGLINSLKETDVAPTASVNTIVTDTSGVHIVTTIRISTDTSSQIRYRWSGSPLTIFTVSTLGWRANPNR